MAELYIGLMSGTSADGVDAALVDFSETSGGALIASHYVSYPDAVRNDAIALNAPQAAELDLGARLGVQLADCYASAVQALLTKANVESRAIAAIGCHGQTVRHNPSAGYTIQLGHPARLAEQTGITVVADFRSRDVAAGGQGAPLAPGYHRVAFADAATHRVILNLGGIANITDLAPCRPVIGFDTGPANALMDLWTAAHLGTTHDSDGAFAAAGTIDAALLARLLAEPYFALPPPKSTGRDLFNEGWLRAHSVQTLRPADVQATLLELTAQTIADAIARYAPTARELYACGGGVHNRALMATLAQKLAPISVATTTRLGVDPDWLEAIAFAWLARASLRGEPGNIASVTGARGPRVLGAIYPA